MYVKADIEVKRNKNILLVRVTIGTYNDTLWGPLPDHLITLLYFSRYVLIILGFLW